MIRDAHVLREGFVPNDVVHRDHEVNALSAALDPVTDGQPADPVLISGASGTGKTTIAKFVVNRLRETVLGVESVHVNCWQAYSRFKAIYEILESLGRTVDVHRGSTPNDELLDRLVDYDGPPVVVTLDEIDQHDDARLVYDLHRLTAFSFILITNDEDRLMADLDERVRSRLQTARSIQFERYHIDELADILDQRVAHGLEQGAITSDQVEWIANAAAGDARMALSILRTAARTASHEHADRITDSHIEDAIPEGRNEVRRKTVASLRPDQQLVFEILQEAGTISPGELYEQYAEEAEDPMTKRTVRKWLNKFVQYNIAEASGRGPKREYQAVEEYQSG